MIPNCRGCEVEYEWGLEQLELGNSVCWDGLGEQGKHLSIAVFDKEGNCILS